MDVCVLGCTPRHIPRYMGQTSNNKIDSRFVFLLDLHINCNSDSIRLDIRWYETKGIYMRVSLFGLFLRCTSLMGPWSKRIQSLLLNNRCQVYFMLLFPLYIPVMVLIMIPVRLWFQWWFLLWLPLWFQLYLLCMLCFPVWLLYELQLWFYTLGYSVAWDKGIYMRVSLFGLFLRCTSLMWP